MIRAVYYSSRQGKKEQVDPNKIVFINRLLRNLPENVRKIIERRESSFYMIFSDITSPFLVFTDSSSGNGLAGGIVKLLGLEPLEDDEVNEIIDSIFHRFPHVATSSDFDKLYLIDLIFPDASIVLLHNIAIAGRAASYRGLSLDEQDLAIIDYLPRPVIDIYPMNCRRIGEDVLRLFENVRTCTNIRELYEKEKNLIIHYLHGLGRARGRVNPRPFALAGGDIVLVVALRGAVWYEPTYIGYLTYFHLVRILDDARLEMDLPRLAYFEIRSPSNFRLFLRTFRSVELLLKYSVLDSLSLVLRLLYELRRRS